MIDLNRTSLVHRKTLATCAYHLPDLPYLPYPTLPYLPYLNVLTLGPYCSTTYLLQRQRHSGMVSLARHRSRERYLLEHGIL